LAFIARRLLAEFLVLVIALRDTGDQHLFDSLPTIRLEGLTDDDARALFATTTTGHVDMQVRDRIVAETCGNPLALTELARSTNRAELGGGFAVPKANTLSSRMEEHYVQRIRSMPVQTQQLM